MNMLFGVIKRRTVTPFTSMNRRVLPETLSRLLEFGDPVRSPTSWVFFWGGGGTVGFFLLEVLKSHCSSVSSSVK